MSTGSQVPDSRAAGGGQAAGADDVAARLYVAVGRLVRMLRRTSRTDVSPGAFSALAALHGAGPTRLGDLAAREGVAAPTMTRIVASLEDAGYVQRAPDPQDGRAVLVDVTPTGAAMVVGERSTRSQELRRRVAGLSASERQALLAALEVLETLARDEEA